MGNKVSLSTEQTYILADYMQDLGNQKIARRLLAISLRHYGYTIKDIALIIGVSQKSVSNWIQMFLKGGFDALLQQHYVRKRDSKLGPYEDVIKAFRAAHPEARLLDLQTHLKEEHDLEVEYSWLYRYIDRHGL